MKVAIVSRGLPDALNLMNGIFEFDQAKALVMAGVEVKLLVVDLRSIRRWRHFGISHEVREGVDCYIISVPLGNVSYSVFCLIGTTALNILYRYAYRDREKPDIIHGHFTRQGYMAAKLSEKIGVPLVVTEHSSNMHTKHISGALKRIAKKTYCISKKTIAVSRSLARSIKENTGIDSIVVPNIVDTSLFELDPGRIKNESVFTYVSVGALIRVKRMDLLISAFKKVHEKFNNTKLVIFGRGEEDTHLRSMIQSYGLQGCIELRGLVERGEIAAEYRIADAFVLLSERETFGVSYIEALSAGLPIIATKCGGPEDFMRDEFGYLIDPNNEEQAVQAMERIYERIGEFYPERISKKIRELYSSEAIATQLIDIYQQQINASV